MMMMMSTPLFSASAPHQIPLNLHLFNNSSTTVGMESALGDLSPSNSILGSSGLLQQPPFDLDLNNRSGVCSDNDGNPLSFLCSKDNTELIGTLIKAAALGLIILFTIFGNVLVLMSVAVSRNLRSSTHYLIVNLAVADLLLGTTVLPFSAVFEVTGRWYFGQTFCTVWAAVDVLCCTSSILSLCVISVDRYIGVTRPLAYSTIMVGKRTSLLIVLIWTSSVAISIGPLLGWKEPISDDPYFCTVNKQLGYVLFSVTGSFYLPMLIIIFVYWKIYKAAIRQTKFLECGHKTTKQDVTLRGQLDNKDIVLRVHLGGNYGNRMHMNQDMVSKFGGGGGGGAGGTPKNQRPCTSCASGTGSVASDGDLSIAAAELNTINSVNLLSLAPLARPEKSSTSSIGGGVGGGNNAEECNNHHHNHHAPPQGTGGNDPGVVLRVHRGGGGKSDMTWGPAPATQKAGICGNKKHPGTNAGAVGRNGYVPGKSAHPQQMANDTHNNHQHHHRNHHAGHHHHHHNNGSQANSLTPSPPSSSPERKLNPGFGKIAKFRRQKKAAKTLAIVVGVFLICWMPFFVALPLGALCEQCNIPQWMFNLFFWLGYCNSCLNPIIYGCTSREFQRAFRKILCRRLPPRPHISRAIYRANMCNNNRFGGERPSGGGHNGNAIPLHHWS